MEATAMWEILSGLPTAAAILYIWIVSNKDRSKEQDAWRKELRESSKQWREDMKTQNSNWRVYMSDQNKEWRVTIQNQTEAIKNLTKEHYGKEKRG